MWRLHTNRPVRKSESSSVIELTSRDASADDVIFAPEGVPNRVPRNLQLMFLGLGVSTLFLLSRAIYRLIEVRLTLHKLRPCH